MIEDTTTTPDAVETAACIDETLGQRFALYRGDCAEVIDALPSASVGYSIFSPPFASLYTYSDDPRDMGNCRDLDEFRAHMAFLAPKLLRVLKPGRLVSFHCMNIPTLKSRDGYIGLADFRGDLIRIFQDAGFIYHSEVTIWKDPVTQMQRTKALGLLHKQVKKDSAMSRQGLADFLVTLYKRPGGERDLAAMVAELLAAHASSPALVTMRHPGDNPEPITNDDESFPVALWQRYASPVWMDINPSDTLQHTSAREHEDERHICPLQLEVIRRGLKLWSNEDDVILSPFAGIGSEGVVSLSEGRRFVGVELKGSYYEQAARNLQAEERRGTGRRQVTVMDFLARPQAAR